MAAFMRCAVSRPLNLGGQSTIRLLSLSNTYGFGIPKLNSSLAAATEVVSATKSSAASRDKNELVNQVNRKIDLNIGISHDLFQLLYSSCEKSDLLTDIDAALLLYICSIGPFDSPAEKRAQIADEIWNKLEQFGVVPSTKLYNIRLKVFLANQIPFNPLDELKKMKTLGLNPDKITYGLLLDGFCQQGNIAAANNVLEAIKTAGYLVGVGIFNSFITGHLKAGSPEEASNVLEILRSRGLTPDADTYSRFAMHYAEEGDVESVLKYVNKAESDEVYMSHSLLLDLYRVMVKSGHSNKAEPLLKMISEKGIFRANTMQKSCQLASEGFTDAALQLYTNMPKNHDEKLQYNNGSFLLKAMIINGQSAADVMAVADKLTEISIKALPHRNALLYTYKAGRIDLAVQLLEMMKDKNFEIKVPYIIPAICSYRQKGNKEGLLKVVRMLLELNGDYCLDDKVENLLKFAYPALIAVTKSQQDIIKHFQDYEKSWNFIFFVNDLTNGYTTALKNASGKDLEKSFFPWYEFRQHLFGRLENNWESCVEVLDFFDKQGMKQSLLISLTCDVVAHSAVGRNWDTVDKTVTAIQKKNLKLKSEMKQLKFYSEAPEQLRSKIDELCSSARQEPRSGYQPKTFEQLESMTIEELRQYQKKNPGLRLTQIALLNKILETDDINNIKQCLREFQAQEISLSFAQLMKIVSRLGALGDTESALQYFEKLKQATGNNIRKMVPLNLGIALVKAGNVSGALKMIRAADESTFTKDEWVDSRKLWALNSMMKQSATLDDATKLHSEISKTTTLLEGNETLQVHAAYINRVLKEDNDEELLARLVKMHDEFHVFPCMEQVMARFIGKQDVPLLKKVMDLGISVYGSNIFHIKLALCFIECGLPSKAASILQTPGLKIQEKSLLYGCQYFLKGKKIESLEAFAKITKDLPISRGLMLKYLLEGYIAVNDLNKATQVLDQFAEDFITPPKETIALIVKEHISRNLPVPQSLQAYTPEAAGKTETPGTSSSSSESSSDSDSESSTSEKEDQDTDKKIPVDGQKQKLNTKHSPSKDSSETKS